MNSPSERGPYHLPPADCNRSSSKRSRISSEVRSYVSRRRAWLCAGVVVLLLLMCIGIVFAAHHYYVAFGGQGFLKMRDQDATYHAGSFNVPNAYLPTRKIAIIDRDGSFGGRERYVPMEVPYYACGDQQSSCEAYGQPDICCPVKMSCRPTPSTPSNIYCCNANVTTLDCDGSWVREPSCLEGHFQCLAMEGGGCCPTNSLCSPNGCIVTTNPTTSTDTSAATATGPATIIVMPAAAVTTVKQGEVAHNGGASKEDVRLRLCLPYSCTAILIFIAALMGLL